MAAVATVYESLESHEPLGVLRLSEDEVHRLRHNRALSIRTPATLDDYDVWKSLPTDIPITVQKITLGVDRVRYDDQYVYRVVLYEGSPEDFMRIVRERESSYVYDRFYN